MTNDYDVIIVGGGIAGLFSAYKLRAHKILLLEGSERVGGRVKSFKRGDYWVNLGAQYLAGEGPLWDIVKELAIPYISLHGSQPAVALKNKLVVSEKPARLVWELPLSVRGRVDMMRVGLKIRQTYKRLAHNRDHEDARRFRDELDLISAAEYFSSVTDADVQAIIGGLIRSWMGAEPAEVSAGHAALYIGLSVADLGEVPPFALPIGGNQVIPESIAKALGDVVRTRCPVSSVKESNGTVQVAWTEDGSRREASCRQCIVAVPAYAAVEIIENLDEEHRQALKDVRYGSYINVGFFTSEAGAMRWDGIYAATVADKAFQILINPATVLHRPPQRPPGGSLLAYAGGEPARALLKGSDDEVKQLFLRDLNDLLPETEGVVEEMVVQRWPRAIPYWEPKARARKDVLRRLAGAVHLAGDYMAYPSMQVAATSGLAAASAVESALEGAVSRT